jgi:hypothetical protein
MQEAVYSSVNPNAYVLEQQPLWQLLQEDAGDQQLRVWDRQKPKAMNRSGC